MPVSSCCAVSNLRRKQNAERWVCVTSSLPSLLSPQQWLASTSSHPAQTGCLPVFPSTQSSSHFQRDNNSSKKLYINSQNIAGTSEALPQNQLIMLLKFVSVLPGFHPPHFELYFLVYPVLHIREEKQLRAKGGYNGAAGAPGGVMYVSW